jgi:hypothetical protein
VGAPLPSPWRVSRVASAAELGEPLTEALAQVKVSHPHWAKSSLGFYVAEPLGGGDEELLVARADSEVQAGDLVDIVSDWEHVHAHAVFGTGDERISRFRAVDQIVREPRSDF